MNNQTKLILLLGTPVVCIGTYFAYKQFKHISSIENAAKEAFGTKPNDETINEVLANPKWDTSKQVYTGDDEVTGDDQVTGGSRKRRRTNSKKQSKKRNNKRSKSTKRRHHSRQSSKKKK